MKGVHQPTTMDTAVRKLSQMLDAGRITAETFGNALATLKRADPAARPTPRPHSAEPEEPPAAESEAGPDDAYQVAHLLQTPQLAVQPFPPDFHRLARMSTCAYLHHEWPHHDPHPRSMRELLGVMVKHINRYLVHVVCKDPWLVYATACHSQVVVRLGGREHAALSADMGDIPSEVSCAYPQLQGSWLSAWLTHPERRRVISICVGDPIPDNILA